MAPITLYEITIDVYIKSMESLKQILQKAVEHAPEESASYPSARLYEDMLPLSFQVQTASNLAKKAVERLLPEKEVPFWEDNETTMEQLFARIDNALELLKSVKPEEINGLEDKRVEVKTGRGTSVFEGKGMALGMSAPNVFFHVTTAYAILRSKGVPLGKFDYLGPYVKPWVLEQK